MNVRSGKKLVTHRYHCFNALYIVQMFWFFCIYLWFQIVYAEVLINKQRKIITLKLCCSFYSEILYCMYCHYYTNSDKCTCCCVCRLISWSCITQSDDDFLFHFPPMSIKTLRVSLKDLSKQLNHLYIFIKVYNN